MIDFNQKEQRISFLGTFIWLLAAIFFLYEFFLRTFVGTVANNIISDLHLNAETFSLLGTAYFLSYGLMQIPVGILCDKFGVKKIMVFACIVCSLATLLFARANNFETAFAGRFFMGFGSSFAFICLLVVSLTWFPKKYFGFFAGASQFVGTMGPLLAAGPLMTFMATQHESWRDALIQTGIFGMVLTVLILLFIKNKPEADTQAVIRLKRTESLPKQIKKLFKNRQAWGTALYSALVYIAIFILGAIWGTDYLEAKGLTQTTAAYCISISWIGYAIGCPLLGIISDITKRRKPLLIIASILGFISTITMIYWQNPSVIVFGITLFFIGIAASGQSVGFAFIAEHVDSGTKSTALGLNNGMITLFSSILPPITGWLIDVSSDGNFGHLTPENFYWALIVLPIFYIAAFLISTFLLKETFCRSQKEVALLSIQKM